MLPLDSRVSSVTLNRMPSRFRITPDRAVLIGLLLTAAVFFQDLRYDFLLDDVPLILLNSTIASWHNWKILFLTHIFYFKESGAAVQALHYRPAFTLWLMLNRQIFGLILPWWHLTSLLLHLVVSLLVYELGLELLNERWTAAMAALLFAFHPIHAESVAYVSASSELLATLFVLAAMLWYLRFRKQGSIGYLVAAVFAAALAMLSKETAAMLPWMLVAYEWLRENHASSEGRWSRFAWTLPFFAVVLAYSVVRTSLFGRNLWPGPGGNHLAAILDIPLVLLVYSRNLLAPFELSFYYPVEWISHWSIAKACGVILLLVSGVFMWRRDGNRQMVRLQIVWLAILLVPPIMAIFTFISGDSVHDRYLYLASVPFCVIAATLLADPRLSTRLTVGASSLVLSVLLVVTAFQVPSYADEITLFKRAVQIAPQNSVARGYYASALWNYGRHDEAFQQFRKIIELSPQSPFGYENLAAALAESGRDEEACEQYRRALDRTSAPTPFRASVLYHLGMMESRRALPSSAVEHMRAAVQIDPENPSYHLGLAQALREEGRVAEASEELHFVAELRQRQAGQAFPR